MSTARPSRRPPRSRLIVGAGLLLATAACDQTLETGYVPRPLNASDADRRSYYAPAFSPESHPDKDSSGTGFSMKP